LVALNELLQESFDFAEDCVMVGWWHGSAR
jgi:hypothetical protein